MPSQIHLRQQSPFFSKLPIKYYFSLYSLAYHFNAMCEPRVSQSALGYAQLLLSQRTGCNRLENSTVIEAGKLWGLATGMLSIKDPAEVSDAVRETEKSEVGGISGKCGVRKTALGICCFCCPGVSPFRVVTGPQICFRGTTLSSL